MRNALFVLVFALTFLRCGYKSASEPNGVQAIANYYGGKVVYSEGILVSSNEDKVQGKYFGITLTEVNESIWSYYGSFDLPASNCAYLLYHSLSPKKKNECSFVRVVIEGAKSKGKYDFTAADLIEAEKAVQMSDNLIEIIKQGDYDGFIQKRSGEADPKGEWVQQIPLLRDVDSKYGKPKGFNIHGFKSVGKNIDGRIKWFVRVSGVLIRQRENTVFSLTIDPSVQLSDKYLYGFDFKKNTEGLRKIDVRQ